MYRYEFFVVRGRSIRVWVCDLFLFLREIRIVILCKDILELELEILLSFREFWKVGGVVGSFVG